MFEPCSQNCTDLPIGYSCSCRPGYELAPNDATRCHDVDECARVFPCSQFCVNTDGGFHCSCAAGWELGVDKKSCKVSNSTHQPKLIVSNRFYVRELSTHGDTSRILQRDLNNAVAVDFFWHWPSDGNDSLIFWSDVTNSGSSIRRMRLSDGELKVLHENTVRNPDGISVDWIGKNLYWCDKTTDSIEVSTLEGKYRQDSSVTLYSPSICSYISTIFSITLLIFSGKC